MPVKVHLQDLIMSGYLGYRLYISFDAHAGQKSFMRNATIETFEKYCAIPEDSAFIDDSKTMMNSFSVREFLQAMSDAAWEIGIKPKGVDGHTNELKAVRYHLEDMRKLAKVNNG